MYQRESSAALSLLLTSESSPSTSSESNEENECPLCIRMYTEDERLFFRPCPCGYQLCQWCCNRIIASADATDVGRCPGCRSPYDEDYIKKLGEKKQKKVRAQQQQQQQKRTTKSNTNGSSTRGGGGKDIPRNDAKGPSSATMNGSGASPATVPSTTRRALSTRLYLAHHAIFDGCLVYIQGIPSEIVDLVRSLGILSEITRPTEETLSRPSPTANCLEDSSSDSPTAACWDPKHNSNSNASTNEAVGYFLRFPMFLGQFGRIIAIQVIRETVRRKEPTAMDDKNNDDTNGGGEDEVETEREKQRKGAAPSHHHHHRGNSSKSNTKQQHPPPPSKHLGGDQKVEGAQKSKREEGHEPSLLVTSARPSNNNNNHGPDHATSSTPGYAALVRFSRPEDARICVQQILKAATAAALLYCSNNSIKRRPAPMFSLSWRAALVPSRYCNAFLKGAAQCTTSDCVDLHYAQPMSQKSRSTQKVVPSSTDHHRRGGGAGGGSRSHGSGMNGVHDRDTQEASFWSSASAVTKRVLIRNEVPETRAATSKEITVEDSDGKSPSIPPPASQPTNTRASTRIDLTRHVDEPNNILLQFLRFPYFQLHPHAQVVKDISTGDWGASGSWSAAESSSFSSPSLLVSPEVEGGGQQQSLLLLPPCTLSAPPHRSPITADLSSANKAHGTVRCPSKNPDASADIQQQREKGVRGPQACDDALLPPPPSSSSSILHLLPSEKCWEKLISTHRRALRLAENHRTNYHEQQGHENLDAVDQEERHHYNHHRALSQQQQSNEHAAVMGHGGGIMPPLSAPNVVGHRQVFLSSVDSEHIPAAPPLPSPTSAAPSSQHDRPHQPSSSVAKTQTEFLKRTLKLPVMMDAAAALPSTVGSHNNNNNIDSTKEEHDRGGPKESSVEVTAPNRHTMKDRPQASLTSSSPVNSKNTSLSSTRVINPVTGGGVVVTSQRSTGFSEGTSTAPPLSSSSAPPPSSWAARLLTSSTTIRTSATTTTDPSCSTTKQTPQPQQPHMSQPKIVVAAHKGSTVEKKSMSSVRQSAGVGEGRGEPGGGGGVDEEEVQQRCNDDEAQFPITLAQARDWICGSSLVCGPQHHRTDSIQHNRIRICDIPKGLGQLYTRWFETRRWEMTCDDGLSLLVGENDERDTQQGAHRAHSGGKHSNSSVPPPPQQEAVKPSSKGGAFAGYESYFDYGGSSKSSRKGTMQRASTKPEIAEVTHKIAKDKGPLSVLEFVEKTVGQCWYLRPSEEHIGIGFCPVNDE